MKQPQQWKAQWNGHPIRVEHESDVWGKGQTCAFIDGLCAHRVQGQIYHDLANVESEFEDESGTHRLRVKVNAASWRKICHIFVDGELIGGDTDKKIALTEAEIAALPIAEQRRLLKRQLVWNAVIAPAIVGLFLFWLGIYANAPTWWFPYFHLLIMLLPNIVGIHIKLRQLSDKDDTKNSTSV